MATLHVRNVPEQLYEALRARADANGRSIGAEAIQLLELELAFETVRRGGFVGRRRRGSGPGLFATFTPPARGSVVAAQEAARELGHAHVGTEHLVLGLLRSGEGDGGIALRRLGLDLERALAEVESRVGRGEQAPAGQIPFRPDAKKALELALRESLALRHDSIGTEHVLLGVVAEGESLGAELVRAVEPDPERVRACVLGAVAERNLASPAPFGPGTPPPFSVGVAHFRVLELEGSPSQWEATLNDAAAKGYELVEIVGTRAVLRRP